MQSATLKLICDREKEVKSFIPEEYWTIEAQLKSNRSVIKADLVSFNGEKLALDTQSKADALVAKLEGASAVVSDVRTAEKVIRPKPPFITSTLQQTAANRLGFTSKKTMQIAQKLYEGVSLGAQRTGLITYMRTDSTRIAESAIAEARQWIGEHHPQQLPSIAQHYSSGSGSQDAHEAVRPTKVSLSPELVSKYLAKDELRLYSLIWERFRSEERRVGKECR